jgi:hypothetical protein
LRDLAAQHLCHLALQLLLIEDASRFWRWFPHSWRKYYQSAIERGSDCWQPQELAEIYLLGRQLYFYDQTDKDLQREAAAKAFELAPYNSRAIIAYFGQFYEELSADVRIELVERISQSNPDHPQSYYWQARRLEEYASESGETRYWDAAIKAYQAFLEMAVRIPQSIPNRVAEEAIKRITEMNTRLD